MSDFDPTSDEGQSAPNQHAFGSPPTPGSGPVGNGAKGSNGSSGNGAADHANGNGSGGALATIPATSTSLAWSHGVPSRPTILSAKPNPIELTHAVRRRWALAIGLAIPVALLAAFLVWYFVPVQYEAYTLLRVPAKKDSVLATGGSDPNYEITRRTYAQLLVLPSVLEATCRERLVKATATYQAHEKYPGPQWLREQIMTDYLYESEIMRVAMKGQNPKDILVIVDALVENYMTAIVDKDKLEQAAQTRKLKDKLDKFDSDIQTKEKELWEMEFRIKPPYTEAGQIARQQQFAEWSNENTGLKRLQTALHDTEMQLQLVKKRGNGTAGPSQEIINMQLEEKVANHQQIRPLDEKIDQLEDLIHRQGKNLRAGNPKLTALEAELAQTKDKRDRKAGELTMKWLDFIKQQPTAAGPAGLSEADLTAQIELLQESIEKSQVKLEKMNKELFDKGVSSELISSLRDDIRDKQAVASSLRIKLEQLNLDKDALSRVQRLEDKAVLLSARGTTMRVYAAMVFAALLSAGAVVLAVGFLEFQSRKVNNPEEVSEGLGIRVVGELPNISGQALRKIKGGNGQAVLKALISERIDGTRAAMIHSTHLESPRVVMITSAEPREGKTTTATQLAASLARSGRRTLIVDADVRNPGVHRVFEMAQDPGLCELLRGELDRDAVVQPTRTTNLWLLPAGRCDLKGVQALSSAHLGAVIAALAAQFDFVVIDSGPVLKVADPLLIGQHCDVAILSVLRDVSQVPRVYEATERLRSVGITVLGAVINGVNDDVARHGVQLLMAESAS